MSVTLLLADDHPIVRQGLRHLLEGEPEFRIVGEAGDGVEALQLVERLKPNILVLDMMMPGLNGLEVLHQIKNISPTTRTIVLSMHSADAYVIKALKNGAAGYVIKETGPSELVNAVREVIQGNQFLSAKISERFQASGLRITDTPTDTYETLTAREREILQMTVEGQISLEIGDKLMISSRTVEVHRSKLTIKLGIKNQADLIRFAIKRGILSMED
ncbi:MAG: response regulator transcription factor [Pseudomonadota bacterium]